MRIKAPTMVFGCLMLIALADSGGVKPVVVSETASTVRPLVQNVGPSASRRVKPKPDLTARHVVKTVHQRSIPNEYWLFVSKRRRLAMLLKGRIPIGRMKCSVGSGKKGQPSWTVEGWRRVTESKAFPTWMPSRHIRQKLGLSRAGVIGPGSLHNALGTRWIQLAGTTQGLHGTNEPKNIGQVTYGCVAFTNRDIELIAARLAVGSRVYISP